MSKLPKILANNSEGFKSTFPSIDISSNEIYNKITQSDYPLIQKQIQQQPAQKFNAIVFENKLNEFESKFSFMEETNKILLNRLTATEHNFELQIKEISVRAAEDREHRIKAEKALSILTDQSSLSTGDLQMKLHLLQDLIEKEDKYKNEQRERDIEIYKNLINKLTEKVSETVKAEIQARFQADIDNKTNTNNVMIKFETEIDLIRKEIADLVNQTKIIHQQTSRECSERTHNVSKYVDMQISDAVFGKGSSSDNLKNFVHKLTDQIKTNLISQNSQNEMCNSKLNQLENMISLVKEDFYKFVKSVEERLIDKMKDVKMFSEANITKCHEQLTDSINELAKNTDESIEFIAKHLSDTRIKANKQMMLLDQANQGRFKATYEDISTLANRVYLYENILKQQYEENVQLKDSITETISKHVATYDVHIVNERIIHSIENNLLKEDIEKCKVAILNMNNSISSDMGKMNQQSESVYTGVVQRINYLQELLNTLAEKNISMFDEFQKGIDQIEIHNLMNEILFKAENENVLGLIQNSKNEEHYLHLNVNNHQQDIELSKQFLSTHTNDIKELKDQMAILYSTLNNSGSNISGIALEIQKIQNSVKDNEIREGARAVLEDIFSNADKALENKNNKNEEELFSILHQLENKIIHHEQMNEKEFIKLWKELGKEKPKEQGDVQVSPNSDESEVKNTLAQVLNNVEFTNIYSLLNQLSKNALQTIKEDHPILNVSDDLIDSKIAKLLEKIRNDNINMWIHAIQLTQKVNQPEEIRTIIQSIPPVVSPLNETLKRILDVDYREGKEAKPFVPQLGKDIRNAEEYQQQKKDNDVYENYMQKPENSKLNNDNKSNKQSQQENKSNKTNSQQPEQKSQNKFNPQQDNVSNKEGSQNKGGKLKKDPNVSNKDTSQFK